MATEFTIYQIKEDINTIALPWVDRFYEDAENVFYERRPLSPFYEIRDTLYKKNIGGDDFVEILPEDYHLLKKYIKLSKLKKEGHKFVCCII